MTVKFKAYAGPILGGSPRMDLYAQTLRAARVEAFIILRQWEQDIYLCDDTCEVIDCKHFRDTPFMHAGVLHPRGYLKQWDLQMINAGAKRKQATKDRKLAKAKEAIK